MSIAMATWVVRIAEAYLGFGLVFAVWFLARVAGRIDPAAARGTLGFRILVAPGVALLWPLLLARRPGASAEKRT